MLLHLENGEMRMKAFEAVEDRFYAQAEQLELALGDPMNPTVPFSFQRSVELDEQEAFPGEFCRLLETWGLQDYYIPAQLGGKLQRFDEVFALLRVVARRDLSVAIAHSKTFLGSAPVWIAGTPAQQNTLARAIREGAYIALALTEEEHGSDLASSECLARKIHGRYVVSGTKWLINNATRSTALCLLARTHVRGKSLGVSLLLVEKNKLDPEAFHHLPKIKTHGIRGIDLSGIRFENASVAEDALIGKEHHGLEPLFKTFQITRPMCSALSLGAADTALRLTLRFSLQRRLYGDTVFAIPAARDLHVEAFSDILISDCVSLVAARALHIAPEQMSLWSSVTKYFVPTLLENAVHTLATTLGARYYLREHYACGFFQKIVRDIAIVGLFDGSTRVNLSMIAGQLGQIARHAQDLEAAQGKDTFVRLESLCTLEEALPEFQTERLVLSNHGLDDLQIGLLLAGESSWGEAEMQAVKEPIATLMQRFARERRIVDQEVCDLVAGQGDMHFSTAAFNLAIRHCVLHAASACYYVWLFNRTTLNNELAPDDWLVLCLSRLLKILFPGETLLSPAPYVERAARALEHYLQEDRLFSLMPVHLAPSQPDLLSPSL